MQIKVLCLTLALSLTAAATSQHETFKNAVAFYRVSLKDVKGLDTDKATLDNPAAAKNLIQVMLKVQEPDPTHPQLCPLTPEELKQAGKDKRGPGCLPTVDGTHPDVYVLIHLVTWSDSLKPDKPKVQANHWYLYRDEASGKWSQEDFTTAKRLLGVKRVYVLYLQFKAEHLG